MTDILRVSINIYAEKQHTITLDDCYNDFMLLIKNLEPVMKEKKRWYLTGYSRKQALENIAFDDSGPTEKAIKRFERSLKKDEIILQSIWDGESDENSCSIDYFQKFIFNNKRVHIGIHLSSLMDNVDAVAIVHFLQQMAKEFTRAKISIESNGYFLHNKNVFPDRLGAGWMLFLPKIIQPAQLPQTAKALPVYKNAQQIGTIIISVDGIFCGDKPEHIHNANDVEIALVSLGVLPLFTEIYD